MNRRSLQVSRQLQETLGLLLEREIRDPRLQLITITRVQTTDDLQQARVFVSVLEEERQSDVLRALRKASGFLRRKLSVQLNMRYTPTLTFALDDSIARTEHLLKVIDKIAEEKNR